MVIVGICFSTQNLNYNVYLKLIITDIYIYFLACKNYNTKAIATNELAKIVLIANLSTIDVLIVNIFLLNISLAIFTFLFATIMYNIK